MHLLFHRLFFCEEGILFYRFLVFAPLLTFIEKLVADSYPFMIISPDGIIMLNEDENSTVASIEFKCPRNDIHAKIPTRYLLQCLSY